MELALGMYSVYSDFLKNPEETLKKVSEMGIKHIEFYGDPIMSAEKMKALLNKYGLNIIGWHVEWKFLQERTIDKTIAYHKEIGNHVLMIPALGGPWEVGHTVEENTSDRWLIYSARMAIIQERLDKHEFRLGYHTHDYDFGEILDNGKTSFDIIEEHAPKKVFLEVDTGNCIEAKKNPIDYLNRIKEQGKFVHCKPYSFEYGYNTRLGTKEDLNNWQQIVSEAKKYTEYFILETEAEFPDEDKFNIVENDIKELKKYLA
jgi:Xylose isomerase-like TIM barrel.